MLTPMHSQSLIKYKYKLINTETLEESYHTNYTNMHRKIGITRKVMNKYFKGDKYCAGKKIDIMPYKIEFLKQEK